jgi:hypothetical protein
MDFDASSIVRLPPRFAEMKGVIDVEFVAVFSDAYLTVDVVARHLQPILPRQTERCLAVWVYDFIHVGNHTLTIMGRLL